MDHFVDEQHPTPEMANHRQKFGEVKDAINRQWKECVMPGKALTHDESRIAGWYKSAMTIGPEPKPIRTGATLHTLAVTYGMLAGYEWHEDKVG